MRCGCVKKRRRSSTRCRTCKGRFKRCSKCDKRWKIGSSMRRRRSRSCRSRRRRRRSRGCRSRRRRSRRGCPKRRRRRSCKSVRFEETGTNGGGGVSSKNKRERIITDWVQQIKETNKHRRIERRQKKQN